ncbi:hypothetical protein E3P84_00799 [Wallemia ichthyophaga]|nr:hypothetical protein E3P84_00799 [Wallemia ichthyophaga]TIB42971.1 hypothetical protein E3P83_00894 [Wallemia ichthyophaga]
MSSRTSTPRQKYAGFDHDQDVEGDEYYDDDGDEYPEEDGGDGDGDGDDGRWRDGDGDGDNDGDADNDAENDAENDVEDGDDNAQDGQVEAETANNNPPADTANTADAPDTAETPVKRGRGRPRGRPKGSGRGLSTPRGTPSGRPRGRGRGRGRAAARNKDRAKGVGRFGNRRRDEDGTEEINFGYIAPEKPAPRILRSIGGNDYWYTEDELEIDDDVRGDQKVDMHGNLLGGRCYKMPTFTSSLRHDREKVYMLSIDAARGAGFKDSLYMFRRNLHLVKLTLEQDEKERLIGEGKLAANSRSRSVTIVAARNVYKLFGAKVLVNGKHVEDDYYEDRARRYCADRKIEPGTICTVEDEGQYDDLELAGLSNAGPNFGTKFLSRAVGGWAYDIGAALFSPATTYATKRALLGQNITHENWTSVYAREVRATNDEIAYLKRLRLEEAHSVLVKAEMAGMKKNKSKVESTVGVSGTDGTATPNTPENEDARMDTSGSEGVASALQSGSPQSYSQAPLHSSHTQLTPTPQPKPHKVKLPRPPPPSKKKKDKYAAPIEHRFEDVRTNELGRLDIYTNTAHRTLEHQSTEATWEKVSVGPEVEGLDTHKQYIGGSKLGTQGFSLASISWELDGRTLAGGEETSRPMNAGVLDLEVTY